MASKIILAHRYARALSQSSKNATEVSKSIEGLEALSDLMKNSEALNKSLTSPQFTTDAKKAVLDALATKVGLDDSLKKFLSVLLEAGRIEIVPEILNLLREDLLKTSNTARAQVKSAIPLSAAQEKQLGEALEAQTKKKIQLEVLVDPALIAGIQVSLLGRTMDGSLAACLDGLATKLRDMNLEGNA